MQRILFLFTCLALLGGSDLIAQLETDKISPRVLDALTRIIRNDGTVTAGLFFGVSQDSVWLLVGGKLQIISRDQMLRLSIERKAERGKATITGVLLGMYAGNLAFLRASEQPFAFFRGRESESSFLTILANAVFAAAGGGIGSLVGGSTETESFDFTKSEEANQQEWNRLLEFVSETGSKSNVHLSFQGSWVDTYLPNSSGYYSGSHSFSLASNLNLMRKMQLTYSVVPVLDAGIALMWLGQPSSSWYTYSSSGSTSGSVQMTGHGYYVVGVLKPLRSFTPRNLQWDVGAGIGLASVDYYSHNYTYGSSPGQTSDVTIKKSVFSGVVFTEAKAFVSSHCSLGIAADYVIIPKKIPDIHESSIGSRSMGTTSIGFALGLHF